MYYYETNKRGSFDILKKDTFDNITFVADVILIEDAESIVFVFNGE